MITSWKMERACEAAYWRALNHVMKRSFVAFGLDISMGLEGRYFGKSTIYRFNRVRNIERDPRVDGKTRGVGTVLGINFAAVRTGETMCQP